MRIGIDIDGVLANFDDSYIDYHNNIHGTNFSRQDMHRYHFWKNKGWNLSENETQEEVLSFYDDAAFEDIPVVEGAREGVLELSKKGYEMNLISARPDFLRERTFSWTGRYFLNMFEMIYFTNSFGITNGDKSGVCFKTGHGILVENYLDGANECAEKNIKVFLLNYSHNQCNSLHPNVTRANDWEDLTKHLI